MTLKASKPQLASFHMTCHMFVIRLSYIKTKNYRDIIKIIAETSQMVYEAIGAVLLGMSAPFLFEKAKVL